MIKVIKSRTKKDLKKSGDEIEIFIGQENGVFLTNIYVTVKIKDIEELLNNFKAS